MALEYSLALPGNMVKTLRWLEHSMRTPLAVVCAYEAVAIASRGKLPPVSDLCVQAGVANWAGPLVGILATWHIMALPRKDSVDCATRSQDRSQEDVWRRPRRRCSSR